jgi:drug/metabolite transporter (DMT)-like permease
MSETKKRLKRLLGFVRREWSGLLLLTAASFFFAIEPMFLKNYPELDPVAKAGVRALGAFIMLFCRFRRVPVFRFRAHFIMGILAGALVNNCWLGSVTRIMVGSAIVLFYSSMLWSVLIKRLFPVNGIWEMHPIGFWLGVLAGFFFAVFLVFIDFEAEQDKADKSIFIDGLMLMQATTFVCSGFYVVIRGVDLPSFSSCGILLLDGAFLYGVGWLLILRSTKKFGIHIVNAYIGATEPFMAILIARAFLGEKMPWQIIGATLLIAVTVTARGIVLYEEQEREKKTE